MPSYDEGPPAGARTDDDGVTGVGSCSTTVGIDPGAGASVELAVGSLVGRFRIIGSLGQGGMGHVHRAHDPKLDREVALKLLRLGGAEAQARFRREAQAMAQLNHPNVLPVYDIGELGDHRGSFIAMELVEGRTLRDWLAARRRHWRQILPSFIAAGRGLQAAHETGLVHRDFKAANVMVGDDGRIRVMDFGLARTAAEQAPEIGTGEIILGTLDQTLTQADTVVGTPPYMSPEQHQGGRFDARSDQYAFCVALWHALHGRYPFRGVTMTELVRAKLRKRPRASGRRLPAWLLETLRRGLSPRPADRFDDMRSLLAALESRSARPRRKRAIVGSAVLGAMTLGAFWMGLRLGDDESPCSGAGDELVGVWDPATRAQVEAAIMETELPYAADTWEHLGPSLDDYATRWAQVHQDVCLETWEHGRQSAALMDQRMRCLGDRLRHLRALVSTLLVVDADVASRAHLAVGELPELDRCTGLDPTHAHAPAPDDPTDLMKISAVRDELARARALEDAGRYDEGYQLVQDLEVQAVALGYGPLLAEVLVRTGSLEDERGQITDALSSLERAYFEAEKWGHDEVIARAALLRASVLTRRESRRDEGMRWYNHARAAIERLDDDRLRARAMGVLASLHMVAGEYARAVTLFEQVLASQERLDGSSHPRFVATLNNLGNAYGRVGRYEDSLRSHRRALAIRERTLGPHHPSVAISLQNLGVQRFEQGELVEAVALQRRALSIWERTLEPDHPDLLGCRVNLANALFAQGEYEQALDAYLAVLERWERTLGAAHPNLAMLLNNIGSTYYSLSRYDEALRTHRRVVSMLGELVEPDHPDLGHSHLNIGNIELERGQYEQALASFGRALAICEQHFGPRARCMTKPLYGTGRVYFGQGRMEEAIATLERGVSLHEQVGGPTGERGVARFELAQVLLAAGRDVAVAIEQAELAREELRTDQGGNDQELAPVDVWLADMRPK